MNFQFMFTASKGYQLRKGKKRLTKLCYKHGLSYETRCELIRKKKIQLIQIIHQLLFLLF